MQARDTLSQLREKERETRKAIIMNAARELFAQKGHDGVSMAEIARLAGIGKSSIYTYFYSQESLFTEIVHQDMAVFIRQLETIIGQKPSNPVKTVIEFFIHCYVSNRQQLHMILCYMFFREVCSKSSRRLDGLSLRLLQLLDGVFEQANYCGDIRFLSHTLLSLLNGILMSNLQKSKPDEHERVKKIGKKIEALFQMLRKKNLDCQQA